MRVLPHEAAVRPHMGCKTEPDDTTESSDVGSVRGTESGSSRSDLQPDWTERKEEPFFLSEKPFYNVGAAML